jgi:hypothetical protein
MCLGVKVWYKRVLASRDDACESGEGGVINPARLSEPAPAV